MRELARRAGLPVADKPESQDLCFLAGTGQQAFVQRHGSAAMQGEPGDIVDVDGRVLGSHDGHHRFTVGQRRGIRVAASEPLYVLAQGRAPQPDRRRPARAARDHDGRARRRRGCTARRARSIPSGCATRVPCSAARLAAISPPGEHGGLTLELEREVAAPAPGQVACLMRGEHVIGWALIEEPEVASGG